MSDADAAMYARVFQENREGQIVLDDLITKFGGALFVKGGEDGRRQTDHNLGKRALLDFILGRVNQASDPQADPEQEE